MIVGDWNSTRWVHWVGLADSRVVVVAVIQIIVIEPVVEIIIELIVIVIVVIVVIIVSVGNVILLVAVPPAVLAIGFVLAEIACPVLPELITLEVDVVEIFLCHGPELPPVESFRHASGPTSSRARCRRGSPSSPRRSPW